MKFKSILLPIVLTVLIVACGPEADDGYVPTKDTVASEAPIIFKTNSNPKAIEVQSNGEDGQSTIISSCQITNRKRVIPYVLVSQDILELDSQNFDFLRPLANPAAVDGVEDRVLSVWALPPKFLSGDGSTITVEVEIQPSVIIFRSVCVK